MLYLRLGRRGASPKAISGRTSYLRVRLEFLPYPHLIPALFNGRGFGPPLPLTAASAWARVDHPVSGLPLLTCTPAFLVLRPIQARFPSGSALCALNLASTGSSPDRSTKSTRSHAHAHAPAACRHRVSGSLSLPSRGPFHLSFTVLYAIGHCRYLALRGGPRAFPLGSSCPVVLRHPPACALAPRTGLSPPMAGLPSAVPLAWRTHPAGPYPGTHACRFGLLPFRSPLLRESLLFSPPPAT